MLEKHSYMEAVRAWEQLCSENRQDPLRWLLLGNAYAGAGRLANAEACYTALIALQPKAMSGYLYRGLCRSEQGNFLAAEKDYSEALLLNPSVAATRINRALTYFALQNFTAAERDTTAAIDGRPRRSPRLLRTRSDSRCHGQSRGSKGGPAARLVDPARR